MTDRGTILNRQSSLTIRLRPYLEKKSPFASSKSCKRDGRTSCLNRDTSSAGKTRASTVARHRLPEQASGERRPTMSDMARPGAGGGRHSAVTASGGAPAGVGDLGAAAAE
jgi:hypothetical protein